MTKEVYKVGQKVQYSLEGFSNGSGTVSNVITGNLLEVEVKESSDFSEVGNLIFVDSSEIVC